MSNVGFSCKETAMVLDLRHPAKASQAMEPAWTKVARHWRIDPARTLEAIIERAGRLEPMSDEEIDLRTRFNEGRVDSREVLMPKGRR